MEQGKCPECRKKERMIKSLLSKIEDFKNENDRIISMSMRGKSMSDIERDIAENKLIQHFRDSGVFSEYNNPFMPYTRSQSLNTERLKESVESFIRKLTP